MKLYDEVEFLNEVLSISSVNGVDDEGNLARFLCSYLKACGVEAVVQEIDKKHANVIGILEGKTKEKVVWNGHIDTVPYGKLTEWSTDPAVPIKKNGCIYARGASDMKSGLAAMVFALCKMKKKGIVPKQTIYFLGTCDEEKNGLGAKKILEDNLVQDASLLLVGEPTGCEPGVAGKGCVWLRLKIYGKTCHGAYPQEGVNAIEYGISIAQELKAKIEKEEHPILGKATMQVTMMQGGIVPNMTPDMAELTLDIRTVPGLTSDRIVEWAQEILQKYNSQVAQELRMDIFLDNDREAIELDLTSPWLKKLEWELRVENQRCKPVGINYFTDASIFVKQMKDTPVLLFGPGEPELAHKPNEYVEIKKYQQYIRILSRLFL